VELAATFKEQTHASRKHGPYYGAPPCQNTVLYFSLFSLCAFLWRRRACPPLASLSTRLAALPGAALSDLLGSTRRTAQLPAEHYQVGSGPRLPVGGGAGEGHYLLAITVALCETLRLPP
jgi:hypothetical protein